MSRATVNPTYLKNMAALWRADPRLAQRLDDLPDDTSLETEPSKSGPMTVAVRSVEGKKRYLHSRYDPLVEAEKFADRVDTAETFAFLISGFGLGYHVKTLYDRLRGDTFIIVAEPSLELLRAAFAFVDHSAMIAGKKCVFLTDLDKADFQQKLQPFNTVLMMGAKLLAHPPSEQVAGAFHGALRALVTDHMAYCKTQLMTLVGNARITCTNVANNLGNYVATSPIDILRDRFRGNPAVVVSAGPSLNRNVQFLDGMTDRVIVIAVQTTFKPLLERGIVPHFVTSLDYAEISRRFFQEVGGEGGRRVHLVAEPKAAWQVIDEYAGPKSLLYNDFAELCIGPELARRGGLKAGATVAHLAFYLAQYMGCDPIIFIGQDLAFTHGVFYAPGAEIHRAWRPELNRFSTIEMKEWERIVRRRPILRKTRDINGQDIYTDEMLFTYLQQFEGDFAASAARVIDASEGGAKKSYTRVMPLREALERFAAQPIAPERLAYLEHHVPFDAAKLPPVRDALARQVEELVRVVKICRETVDTLGEMMELSDDPVAFNRKFIRLDDLRTRIYQNERVMRMITSVSQVAELRRFTADRKIGVEGIEGGELAKRQLKRDIEFLEALLEGAEFLEKILRESKERIERLIEEQGGHLP